MPKMAKVYPNLLQTRETDYFQSASPGKDTDPRQTLLQEQSEEERRKWGTFQHKPAFTKNAPN